VSLGGIEAVVADKGYHSGKVLTDMKAADVRTYIPEKKQAGQRHWTGKQAEQQAVYGNRQRVGRSYGQRLLKKRGELVERSFAHCYDTGGMRRTHLRGHQNILKRQLIHVGAFNLSLILRQLLGAGTPREWRNRVPRLIFLFLLLSSRRNSENRRTGATYSTSASILLRRTYSSVSCCYLRNSRGSATGC
jgi:transposase